MSIAPVPISKFKALRLGAAALVAGVAVFTAGCGTTATAGHINPASASRFTAVHTAQQVTEHFFAATGDRLTVTPDRVTFDTLSTPASNEQDYTRYGVFSIYVLHSPDELSVFTSQNGHRLIPDAQGVYWPTAPDASGFWNPVKVYGNVVLSWTTQSRTTNGQFRLLDAILSTLGKGVSAVEAKLPPTELSCEARGITATSLREGTCTENGVSFSVVNSTSTLHMPAYDVQVLKDKVGSVIPSSVTFGAPLVANGAFLALVVRLENNESSPLEGLDEAELEVDGRYYSQDDEATIDLAPSNAFPVQPGEQSATVLVFDVPQSVAMSAVAQGELAFPSDPDSDIQDATSIGAIRLAGTPSLNAAGLNNRPS